MVVTTVTQRDIGTDCLYTTRKKVVRISTIYHRVIIELNVKRLLNQTYKVKFLGKNIEMHSYKYRKGSKR